MLDLPLGVRIVFRPENDKFSKMMGSQYGPISGQVVEVVHDDSDKEIEYEEGTYDEEADEVDVGKVRPTSFGFTLEVGG